MLQMCLTKVRASESLLSDSYRKPRVVLADQIAPDGELYHLTASIIQLNTSICEQVNVVTIR